MALIIDQGAVWVPEIDSYLIPLFTEEDYPKLVTGLDIIDWGKCPVCGKDLAILDDTTTALYSAWFDIDKDPIMGICTHCGNIQKGKTFTKKIKYIL